MRACEPNERVTLQELIEQNKVTWRVLAQMQEPAVEALMKAREEGLTGSITNGSFVLSSDFKAVHVRPQPGHVSEAEAVAAYGNALLSCVVVYSHPPRALVTVATRCLTGQCGTLGEAHLLLERRISSHIFKLLIIVIVMLAALLCWLNSRS